jgi:Zn-dependent protease
LTSVASGITVFGTWIVAPVLLFSVIAHEYAHGYAALRQGDSTALTMGRLTWNPLKHIDPFLTIILPLVMIAGPLMAGQRPGAVLGGAKPVPVNPENYRNLKRGDIIVSLAGVATNGVIAIAATILIAVSGVIAKVVPATGFVIALLQVMLIYAILINLGLIAFNLIPIPPLDGSHVLKYLLPPSWSLRYQQAGRFGFLILIVLLFYGRGLLDLWMRPAYILLGLLLGTVDGFVLPRAAAWFR